MIHSSTDIRIFQDHCPQALAFYLNGTYRDTALFDVGIAAHAVLEECGRRQAHDDDEQERVADAVVGNLIEKGHRYFGEQKPPMAPEPAFEGRDLALDYLAGSTLPEGMYEKAFYINAFGDACAPEEGRFRALIDLVFEDEWGDEEFSGPCLIVRDYKSSWQAGENELTSLQRKGQAVTVWKNLATPEHIGIVRQVANLRTGAIHSAVTWLDEMGLAELEQWSKDILTVCDAADTCTTARPGMGCLTCPFALECPHAMPRSAQTVEEKAVEYLKATARSKMMADELKEVLKDSKPIAVEGGSVGYHAQETRTLNEEAIPELLKEWYQSIGRSWDNETEFLHTYAVEIGLFKSAGLSVTGFERLLKALYPGRDGAKQRKAFMERVIEYINVAKFGGKVA